MIDFRPRRPRREASCLRATAVCVLAIASPGLACSASPGARAESASSSLGDLGDEASGELPGGDSESTPVFEDGEEAGSGDDADGGDDDIDEITPPKWDVAWSEEGEETGSCEDNPDSFCGCSAVDILFVVDNSVSMEEHQRSLGMAFPQFVDAIDETLPPGVNVHVGVTSTEMGYTGSGTTQNCFAVDGDQFYVTPDTNDTGRNGAQGRLYSVQGQAFADFDTGADVAVLDAAKDWFVAASAIGTGGSNVEMSCAAAGWAADPANDGANAGFIRDKGAVLVVFFVQDEPDQTPGSVGGEAMLEKLVAAKDGCGGLDCIVAGGLVNMGCLGQVPLGSFFDGLSVPPTVEQIPNLGGVDPSEYVRVLKDNLASVIVSTCKTIDPPT